MMEPEVPVDSDNKGEKTLQEPLETQQGAFDICRVCRGEGTEEQALFYPCNCSGSIKYVHQECLVEWLKHSKKKYCELCKYAYTFTPIYREKMPTHLPLFLIIGTVFKHVFKIIGYIIKAAYLLSIWLILMPTITSIIIHVYFGAELQRLVQFRWRLVLELTLWGVLTTLGSVGFGFGFLMLRDYMKTHGLFRVKRHRKRETRPLNEMADDNKLELDAEPLLDNDNNSPFPHSPPPPHQDTMIQDDVKSEMTTAISVATTSKSKSAWLQNVAPRDYRAYLQRRELHKLYAVKASSSSGLKATVQGRERVEKNLVDVVRASDNDVSMDATRQTLGKDPIATTTSLANSRGLRVHDADNPERIFRPLSDNSMTSDVDQKSPVLRPFRDNIQCKVCQSATCISKEHVIESSKRNTLFTSGHVGMRGGERGEDVQMKEIFQIGAKEIVYRLLNTPEEVPENARLKEMIEHVIERNAKIPSSSANHSNSFPPLFDTFSAEECVFYEELKTEFEKCLRKHQIPGKEQQDQNQTPTQVPYPTQEQNFDQRQQRNEQDNPVQNDDWDLLLGVDGGAGAGADAGADAQGMTFAEFIGTSGALINVLQHAALVIIFNLLFFFGILVFPIAIGKSLFHGFSLTSTWIRWIIGQLGEQLSILLADKEHFMGQLLETSIQKYQWLSSIVKETMISVFNLLPASVSVFWHGAWTEASLLLPTILEYRPRSVVDWMLQAIAGQSLFAFLGHVYLEIVTPALARSHSDQEDSSQQDLLWLKVSSRFCLILKAFYKLQMVIVVELILFPMFCGWVFVYSISRLIVYDRISFYLTSPISVHFLHWLLGAVLMTNVSMCLRWFRNIFRPGLLYFISNAEDLEHLPLKEAVEKPLIKHFLQVVISAIFYASMIVALFTGFAELCRLFVPNVVPFNFNYTNMLLEIPYDILAQIMNRMLVKMIDTKQFVVFIKWLLRSIVRSLSLSSYFYGGRYKSEVVASNGRWTYVPQSNKPYKSLKVRKMFKLKVDPVDIAQLAVLEGTFDDDVTMAEKGEENNVTMAANNTFSSSPVVDNDPTHLRPQATLASTVASPLSATLPLPEPRRSRRLTLHQGQRQGQNTRNARTKIKDTKGFTVVYRPNMFPLRVMLFFLGLWGIGQLLGLLFIVIPIITGRITYHYILPKGRNVIDLYAFQLGLMVLTLGIRIVQAVTKSLQGLETKSLLFQVLRAPLVLVKISVFLFITILIWPAIIGFYILTIIMPLISSQGETMVISPFMCWIFGIMLMHSIIAGISRIELLTRGRLEVLRSLATFDGWWNINLWKLTKALLFPYTFRMLILCFGPSAILLLIAPLLDLNAVQLSILQRYANSINLLLPLLVIGVWLGLLFRRKLLQKVRDDNYLVGQVLHNLERMPQEMAK